MIETNVIQGILPNIPRVYTAFAEWLACLVMIYVLPAKRRGKKRIIMLPIFWALQSVFLYLTAGLDHFLWILCMIIAVFFMCAFIYICCSVTWLDTLFYCTIAFIYAEFAASAEWQIYCYVQALARNSGILLNASVLLITYFVLFAGAFILIKKRYDVVEAQNFSPKEVMIMVLIGVLIFFLSNLGFVAVSRPFGQKNQMEIYSARTIMDFAGVAILCAYYSQKENLRAKYDLQRLETIIQNQYLQYQQSQETLDIINYKYHDLKHHIIALRAEDDKKKIDKYLDQMEEEIHTYEAQNKTGNKVLDTMLTSKSIVCSKNKIDFTSVVDGKALDFMKTLDICSIFGNALDNAIEYEKKVPDEEKRLIHLSVCSQKGFVIIKLQNYFLGDEKRAIHNLKTSKNDKNLHGFGVKSIYHTVHKYHGEVDISVQDHWFNLSILVPIPLESR